MSRFDPTTPLESTPPFVRWTLALGCPLREASDYFDPDHTERLLRGVRCYSDALTESRVHKGVVIQRAAPDDDPLGFDVESVLAPLGGLACIEAACATCPANALRRTEPRALAGCVGHLTPPVSEIELWLSLSLPERPSREELGVQRERLQRLTEEEAMGRSDYLLAIAAALQHDIPLVVRAYPGGRCEGRRWYVEPHCDRCKAAWPEAQRQQCRVCGQVGGRQPERRRMRMGTRPYRPLREFLP